MKLFNYFFVILFVLASLLINGQESIPVIKNLGELDSNKLGISNYWLEMGTNTYNLPMLVPIIVFQGNSSGPTLGLTAAIHGNELNGIGIIHQLVESINTKVLNGRIIAIPGINTISIQLDERVFIDEEDLNRNFPGKRNGNRSSQYVYKINERVLPFFDIQIDFHTASFGRENTMYSRADLTNDTLRILAKLQQPDIILNSKEASVGSASSRTMRTESTLKGIPTITVEYGNPQVFQDDIIQRGFKGVMNTLSWLNMYGNIELQKLEDKATYCKKSYWIYMEEGGFLEVTVALNQKLVKGENIATVRNAFGEIIKEYVAPENGIVIGKSSNPANMSGGRIIHLGIIE